MQDRRARNSVLTLSFISFTLMFAVWLQFGILAIPIQKEFGLSDTQFEYLSGEGDHLIGAPRAAERYPHDVSPLLKWWRA